MHLQLSESEFDLVKAGLVLLESHISGEPTDTELAETISEILYSNGETDDLSPLAISQLAYRLTDQANGR